MHKEEKLFFIVADGKCTRCNLLFKQKAVFNSDECMPAAPDSGVINVKTPCVHGSSSGEGREKCFHLRQEPAQP